VWLGQPDLSLFLLADCATALLAVVLAALPRPDRPMSGSTVTAS